VDHRHRERRPFIEEILKYQKKTERRICRAFIVFAKTGEFSNDEIELCRTAQKNPPRVILLSRRELEPTFVYKRAAKQFDIKEVTISLAGLARNTVVIFFDPKPRKPQAE
jgi:hypothetical protein